MFRQTAPFLTYVERNILLDIAGSDGISPVLLLTSAIMEIKANNLNEFREKLDDMSGRMTQAYFNSTKLSNGTENIGTNALRIFVGGDQLKLAQFLSIFSKVKAEIEKDMSQENQSILRSVKTPSEKRDEPEKLEKTRLRWPYPPDECWQIGPTHHSNRHCQQADFCPKAALDMAPSLFQAFGHGFDYFNSEGEVVAAHGGEVYVLNSCKLMVMTHDVWTYYSHIKVNVRSGDRVRPGDHLGYIELGREASNCNCEVK